MTSQKVKSIDVQLFKTENNYIVQDLVCPKFCTEKNKIKFLNVLSTFKPSSFHSLKNNSQDSFPIQTIDIKLYFYF